MAKYLDLDGLSSLWAKIKAALSKKVEVFEFTPGTTTQSELAAAINAGKTLQCLISKSNVGVERFYYTGYLATVRAGTFVILNRTVNGSTHCYYVSSSDVWTEATYSADLGSAGSASVPVYADGGTLKPITDLSLTKSDEAAETSVAVGNSARRSAAVLYTDASGSGVRATSGEIIRRNADGDLVLGDGSWLGNYYTPIFLKDGIPTPVSPSSMHVGTADKLGGSNVGKNAKPIYLVAGSPTASSATVGSQNVPIYMDSGEFKECPVAFVRGNAGSASEPVYVTNNYPTYVRTLKPRRYCSKAYVDTTTQANQYALMVYLRPSGASKSAYATAGMTFRIYVTTTGYRFAATVNAWYRRNNSKLGTLKAYIAWDGGQSPSGTNVYVSATDEIEGHEDYGRDVVYMVHVKAPRYATVMLTVDNVNCNTTVNDTSNDNAAYYDNTFEATKPTETATKKVVEL